jgi:acetyl esterase/lipase
MKRPLISLIFLGLVAWVFFQEIRTAALSGLIMADIMRFGKPPLLGYVTREPWVEAIHYSGGGREMEADLYSQRDGRSHPGLILVHGVNEVGKADARIRWAAQMLCRAGFSVLVPDFLGFKSLRLRPADIQEIADSFLYLSSRPDLVRPDRIGIAGFSYGAGPTLIAGCDPRLRDQIDFIISFGGYYDLMDIIEFVTTGHYSYRGQSFFQAPDEYTQWIFLHYNLDLLSQEGDRRILQEAEVWKEGSKRADLVSRLSPEGKAVYNLLNNKDPGKVAGLSSQLSPRVRQYIEVLSPSRLVKDLKAYLFVIHGVPDPFIPHTESLRLFDSLSQQQRSHLALLRIFTHVRPSVPPPTFSNILFVYIPEGAKLYSLIYHILQRGWQ